MGKKAIYHVFNLENTFLSDHCRKYCNLELQTLGKATNLHEGGELG